ncbi:MAG: glycosyltransferase [Candidatus Nanopelagicales bacterium]
MRIVILAPVHIYDDIRVFRKEAVTLAAAGHEVVLYARTPDGEPLERDGVRVEPVRYRSRLQRFLMLPVVGHRAWKRHADVYHLHNPDTIPLVFGLKARGATVVYDTHEDFATEILLRQWLPRPMRRAAAGAVAGAERLVARVADAVIVTQEQLLDRLPGALVIGNPPIVDHDAGLAAARDRAGHPLRHTVLGYVGGLSADRGLHRMLDLVAALQRHLPVRLLLVGGAVNDDALAAARARDEWRWVDERGRLPQEEAFAALAEADAGLILFEDTASHRHVDPNKIYEYLSLALPVIASDFPDWRRRFAGADIGLFVDPRASVQDLAARVAGWLGDRAAMTRAGRAGVEWVWRNYSWQNDGAPALLALYDRLRPGRR